MAKKPTFSIKKPPPGASVDDVESWVSGGDAAPARLAVVVPEEQPPVEVAPAAAPPIDEARDELGGAGRLNIRVGEARKRALLVWCAQNGRRPGDVVSALIDAHLAGR